MDVRQKEKEWFSRMNGNLASSKENERKVTPMSASSKCEDKEPTKKRFGFNDVAGMDELKELVTEGFINVLKNRECAKAFGIVPPSILFYGPSGCGKTFFAEAMANEVGVNFIKVVPDDIACKWVHGTQEKIGEVFRTAEKTAPTVLFFDEFDAMVPHRTADDLHNQNGEVNEFLCMLNNASDKGIYVIAATNHPEAIDKAVLRTGRIDEIIYVDMPGKAARESLFRLSLAKLPAAEDIDYAKLAELTHGYNCSDISYIVKVASRKMFNASIAARGQPYKVITQLLLENVIAHKAPSVTPKDLREYERMRSLYSPKDANVRMQRIGF